MKKNKRGDNQRKSKKAVCVITLFCMAFSFMSVGCTEKNQTNKEESATTETTGNKGTGEVTKTTETGKTAETTKEVYDSKDGRPALDESMKDFYSQANEIFRQIEFKALPVNSEETIKGNGCTYSLVEDERFSTLKQLREYLSEYFSGEIIDKKLLVEMWDEPTYIDYNGKLYQMDAARGGDMSYSGHVFLESTISDSEISFKAKAYYGENSNVEYFYETPENENMYTVKEYEFKMEKRNGKFIYTKFDNFY